MVKIVPLSENKDMFQHITCIDVLLTNKCNLRCEYCYQQHTANDGYYTLESMKETWDWLRDINNMTGKKLQFFGGEPMLHKKFILDFVETYKDDFVRERGIMTTSIITNGLLVDKPFMERYFHTEGMEINFSIDTHLEKHDIRGLTQWQIDKLIETIGDAIKLGGTKYIAARINITPEGLDTMKELFHRLHNQGLRRFWFHPLTHTFEYSSKDSNGGYVKWTKDDWERYRQISKDIIDENLYLEHFTVVEGVGKKELSEFAGCVDIAMDASGDFSSCFVWISVKEEIIGNIFRDELDYDLYTDMKAEYNNMVTTNKQCIDCDLHGLCYQFGSGNKFNDGITYRPDNYCQIMTDIYIDINNYVTKSRLMKKFKDLSRDYQEGTEVFRPSILMLLYHYLNDSKGDLDEVKRLLAKNKITLPYLLGYFTYIIENKSSMTLEDILKNAGKLKQSSTIKDVYYEIITKRGLGTKQPMPNVEKEDIVYLTFLHLVVISRLDYFHETAFGGYE